jgi:hypothetical protein
MNFDETDVLLTRVQAKMDRKLPLEYPPAGRLE